MNEIPGNSNARFLEIGPNSWFSSPRFVSWNYHRHVDTILWAFFKIRSHLRDWAYTKVWHKRSDSLWASEDDFREMWHKFVIFSTEIRFVKLSSTCWHHILSVFENSKPSRRLDLRKSVTWKWQIWALQPTFLRSQTGPYLRLRASLPIELRNGQKRLKMLQSSSTTLIHRSTRDPKIVSKNWKKSKKCFFQKRFWLFPPHF